MATVPNPAELTVPRLAGSGVSYQASTAAAGAVTAAANGLGDPASDIYRQLLKERIVFLGTQVDQTSANLICAQLLLLEAEDTQRDVFLYVNSPGGSVTDGLAIYDTMQYVRCD